MLELFILESCPYSKKVMSYFKENNIEYIEQDILNPEKLELLIELGGYKQVPFLYDKDKDIKMYESDDIIEYVKGL